MKIKIDADGNVIKVFENGKEVYIECRKHAPDELNSSFYCCNAKCSCFDDDRKLFLCLPITFNSIEIISNDIQSTVEKEKADAEEIARVDKELEDIEIETEKQFPQPKQHNEEVLCEL